MASSHTLWHLKHDYFIETKKLSKGKTEMPGILHEVPLLCLLSLIPQALPSREMVREGRREGSDGLSSSHMLHEINRQKLRHDDGGGKIH